MGRISRADLAKTVYYIQRNGIIKAWNAARERLWEKKQPPYVWEPPAPKELQAQRERWDREGLGPTFSILVPVYRTSQEHLKEMILSLCRQTYPGWELILADATEGAGLESVVRSVWDGRIRYMRIPENGGIAANTNKALELAWGDYVGLLDHDDVLTDNALHEMVLRIEQERKRGVEPELLYSDEDKCSGDGREFFDPHLKEDFNLELLLSNNYICHFLVMKRELMQDLRLRPEYEGAQDYDLVLRVVAEIHDPVTTTDELIPSGETSSFRSNPLGLAEFTLSRKDPEYVGRAKDIQKAETARMAMVNSAADNMAGAELTIEHPCQAHPDVKPVMNAVKKTFGDASHENTGFGSTIFAVKPGDGSAREQAASCQKVLGGWANIANEYATKRYRSNLINWGMLPFLIKEGELPFKNLDYLFIPGIRKAVEEKAGVIKAYRVDPEAEALWEFELTLGELTDEERQIILKGCLINYNRV